MLQCHICALFPVVCGNLVKENILKFPQTIPSTFFINLKNIYLAEVLTVTSCTYAIGGAIVSVILSFELLNRVRHKT